MRLCLTEPFVLWPQKGRQFLSANIQALLLQPAGSRRDAWRYKWSAMSRLDVMYHQSYGAHRYLPATSAAAAAVAYKAAYFHHQQQQQRKLCSYSRMQDSADLCAQGKQTLAREQEERSGGEGPPAKEAHPAEAEYLSSRCVLFTYFQGDIGDVVDEHFSRALSQPSAFSGEPKGTRAPSGGLWREGGALASGQCGGFPSSLWGTGYPSQGGPCLSSLHPDFSPSGAFQSSEPAAWAGHSLHQPGLAPPPAAPDSWHYSLGPQSAAGYPHVHEIPAPHGEGSRSEPDSATHSWPAAFHGSVDLHELALEQEKGKAPVWF
ncbi:hypothetical protein SKAU_G00251410 [Synaphobranchus kaupii]|uniref:Transcription cofactor vestigial-like protein 3 n=1 Tax=Synaphobranchus kaupii TaxID=118154 RepID=A0A9Q1F318_SYNKA|nr:hypothetical protein SKAU_G00251410 [Synaphobranchus kaupii]